MLNRISSLFILATSILMACITACELDIPDQQKEEKDKPETISAVNEIPECGVIVYEKGGGVYRINPDGTNPVRLADGTSPQWSEDGRHILYSTRNEQSEEKMRMSIPWNGGKSKKIIPTPIPDIPGLVPLPKHSSFSPDGTQVAYSRSRSIYVADVISGESSLVAKGNLSHKPSWSPDGEWIAYTPVGDGEVWIAPIDGSREAQLLADGVAPSWSGDGEKIAFASSFEGVPYLYFINRDGSHLQRVTNHPEAIGATFPLWSPGSNPGRDWIGLPLNGYLEASIVSMHYDEFVNPVYYDSVVVWPFKEASTVLPLEDHSARTTFFSHDREWLAYQTRPRRKTPHLHVRRRDDSVHTTIPIHYSSGEFVWSPKQHLLVWSSAVSTGGPYNKKLEEKLFLGEPGKLDTPKVLCEIYLTGLVNGWSPDGTRIAGLRTPSPYEHAVYIVHADTGAFHQITPLSRHFHDFLVHGFPIAWSPDSSTLAFMEPTEKNTPTIRVCDRDGGNIRELAVLKEWDLRNLGFSPDGKDLHIIISEPHNPPVGEVRIIPVDGSAIRTIAQGDFSLASLAPPLWSPDRSRLILQMKKRDEKEWHVWIVNRDGTGLAKITQNPKVTFPLGWSPDGSMCAYGYGFVSDHFYQQRICAVRTSEYSPGYHFPLPGEERKQFHIGERHSFRWFAE